MTHPLNPFDRDKYKLQTDLYGIAKYQNADKHLLVFEDSRVSKKIFFDRSTSAKLAEPTLLTIVSADYSSRYHSTKDEDLYGAIIELVNNHKSKNKNTLYLYTKERLNNAVTRMPKEMVLSKYPELKLFYKKYDDVIAKAESLATTDEREMFIESNRYCLIDKLLKTHIRKQ